MNRREVIVAGHAKHGIRDGALGAECLQRQSGGDARAAWRIFALVLLVAFGARLGWGVYRASGMVDGSALEFPDERQYWLMASGLRSGTGLVDEFGFRATRMPLYPSVLALFAGSSNGVTFAKAMQWAVGSLAALLTSAIALRLFDRRAALVAGLLVALDPFLVFFSSLLLTETLFIVALLVLWWMAGSTLWDARSRPSVAHWVWFGAAAALATYLRESGLGIALALLILIVARRLTLGSARKRTFAGAAATCTIVVLALLPWAVRNRLVTDDWCWLTHRGGISLYDGVGPQADGGSDLADVQASPEVRDLPEAEWNRHFLRASVAAIQADPWRILRLAWVKLGRMWNPYPNVGTYQNRTPRLVSALWTIPVFAFALWGVIIVSKSRSAGGVWMAAYLLWPALFFSAVHCVFVGSVRYRLPAMPLIEILAAVGALAVVDRLWRRASHAA